MIHTINVTQSDIDNGKPFRANECPIAIALSRAIGEPCYWIYRGGFTTESGAHPRRYYDAVEMSLPLEFIREFENDKPAHPFTFHVEETT